MPEKSTGCSPTRRAEALLRLILDGICNEQPDLRPLREDPLWELVGVDDDPGGTVNIDEIVYGGRR